MITPSTPLVFLHAYPLNSSQWSETRRMFGDRPTIAPDLPGFGAAPAEAETLDDFAGAVVRAMDSAGIERAVLIGLSMGGYVAFRFHDHWPERVVALVLADTRAGPDGEEARAKRTAQAGRARTEGIGWLADAMVGDALGSTTRRERPEVVERFRRIIAEAHPEGVARALTAMRDRPDSRPALAGIGVPVLALVGEEDTVTPIDEARVIADGVPDGTLAVVPKAGHLSNLENPSVFIDRIGDFLERHRAG